MLKMCYGIERELNMYIKTKNGFVDRQTVANNILIVHQFS